MGMIIHPCFSRHSVGNTPVRIIEVATIFSQKDQRFIEQVVINRALQAIRAVVREGTRITIGLSNWPSQVIQKLSYIT